MLSNKFTVSLNSINSGSTATTITFPIDTTSQMVGQSELIEREFVDKEVEKAINPILNYDKVRFLPINNQNQSIVKIIYNVHLLDKDGNYVNTYGKVGFKNEDIKFRKESFKKTFIDLVFFDTDNALTQKPVSDVTIFSNLNGTDVDGAGNPNPVDLIPLNFVVENPLVNPFGFFEGFHLYDYKDGLVIGENKYLYMRTSFKNAKTGKAINLMVKDSPQVIDKLVHELYTRYKLIRTTSGYYYVIDDTYQGNQTFGSNNVIYTSNSVTVNLYEIKSI